MEKQFDPLCSYITLAKKTISKFGSRFYNGLSIEMLKNEEAISDVATALMYADWRYDNNRTGKTGEKKTLYSYRNQCAIWAIKTYITNKYKKQKNYSLDYDNDNDQVISSTLPDDKQRSPLDIVIEKEREENIAGSIRDMLNSDILSDKQREQIHMYYFEDATLSSIGEKFGVSREAVRQNIKRGLELIRACDKCLK